VFFGNDVFKQYKLKNESFQNIKVIQLLKVIFTESYEKKSGMTLWEKEYAHIWAKCLYFGVVRESFFELRTIPSLNYLNFMIS
jgi:hypothetical protein